MIYLYSKKNKEIYNTDDYVVLSTNAIDTLKMQYKDDIYNNYGEIVVDDTTMTPIFKFYEINITVDEFNTPRLALDSDVNKVSVTKKEYYEAKKASLKGKIVKFFDNKFFLFDYDPVKDYDPTVNAWTFNINKYKELVLNKIKDSEQEIREHGYYYTFWPDLDYVFVQPFRVVPDNDYQAIKQVMELPKPQRALKLFMVKDGKRLTAVGTYKWIRGLAVTDDFLKYIYQMITAYSNYVKTGIYQLVKYVETVSDLNTLKHIEKNYVDMIVTNIGNELDKLEEVRYGRVAISNAFKEHNILPLNDTNI